VDPNEAVQPVRRWASRRRAVFVALSLAIAVGLGVGAVALANGGPKAATSIEIVIRYSHFEPSEITVPAGVPITITIRNTDPIGHEWIVGDPAVQAVHRIGTELLHPSRPTEVVIPALESRTTTITFEPAAPGSITYICHLPGHEAYGMVGTVTIR
jgi:plastocyanin